MKKFLSLFIFLIFVIPVLRGQDGAVPLSHFRESREIENQSLAICQDGDGVMLFANRRGIMTFDGVNWDFIRMPAVPYSLMFNKNTRKVYAGCDNNYGYIDKDEKGFSRYISLSGDSAETGLVTNIFFTDSTVYFYSESIIRRHNLMTGEFEKKFETNFEAELSFLKSQHYSYAILGCTHYPLVRDRIEKFLNLKTISPCSHVAQRVADLTKNADSEKLPVEDFFNFLSTSNNLWIQKKRESLYGPFQRK